MEGHKFNSSEQFIQAKKAEYFEDDIARNHILAAEDAQDCKEIARDINNFDKRKWTTVAECLCKAGIYQKFLQNRDLLATLLDTGNKTLIEASFDDIWGTGIHIASRDALIRSKWRGIGLLGKILMRVQDSQKESTLIVEDTVMNTDDAISDTPHSSNATWELN